jgi:hypothetical protein
MTRVTDWPPITGGSTISSRPRLPASRSRPTPSPPRTAADALAAARRKKPPLAN